jgi:hypothetical protein
MPQRSAIIKCQTNKRYAESNTQHNKLPHCFKSYKLFGHPTPLNNSAPLTLYPKSNINVRPS